MSDRTDLPGAHVRVLDRGLVKVIYTRGPATARGYAPSGQQHPTRIVLRYPWPPEDEALLLTGSGHLVSGTPSNVFLVHGGRIGIWPARAVQSRTLAPGPVTRRLQGLIEPLLEHAAPVLPGASATAS